MIWLLIVKAYVDNGNMLNKPYIHETWTMKPGIADNAWSTHLTGSGYLSTHVLHRQDIYTGTTNGSIAGVYSDGATITMSNGTTYFIYLAWGGLDPVADTAYVGLLANGGTRFPVMTERHMGFKMINGAIWATSCDGTNAENATDTGIAFTGAWTTHKLYMEHHGSSIQFYVDNVLKATHSTNVPVDYNAQQVYQGIRTDDTNNVGLILKTVIINIPF